jgi:hypothetical protein
VVLDHAHRKLVSLVIEQPPVGRVGGVSRGDELVVQLRQRR